MISSVIDKMGDWNPQLFRELKGRLKPRNMAIAAGISLVGQFLIYLNFQGALPVDPVASSYPVYSRYCTGTNPDGICLKDLLGNWVINQQLWWLDVFVWMSVIGIFVLLTVGTYLLIADLSGEERRGTLNFVRLSPQSAKQIFIGKILGVPILLYLVGALALPLHLIAGIGARIPLGLIFGFYAVLFASCVCFYSAALLFSLASNGLGGFQSWIGSGTVLLFLSILNSMVMPGYSNSHTLFDWWKLFYPGLILPYLVKSTFITPNTVGYFDLNNLDGMLFYGQSLWSNAGVGIGVILFHYFLWTYWIAKGLKRSFDNPISTLLSKSQSYLISMCLAVLLVGFVFQNPLSHEDTEYSLFHNFGFLQAFLILYGLILIVALSPHRQTLQDWARYRHQTEGKSKTSLLKDFLLGEKSPATLAIAVNFGLMMLYIFPVILLVPLNQHKIPVLVGFFLGMNMMLLYAAIAQRILLIKNPKRAIAAGALVGNLIILPIVVFGFLRIDPGENPLLWLFSCVPIAATQYATANAIFLSLLGQWIGITLISFETTKKLQKAGASATKMLLTINSGQ
jgi:hypothetical protein